MSICDISVVWSAGEMCHQTVLSAYYAIFQNNEF